MLKKVAFAAAGIALLASPLISSAATICPSLSRGMKGAEVTRLQQFLATQYTNFGQYVTGFFGPKTEAAVKQWQSEHGIEPVGFVGPKTAAAMGLCRTTTDIQTFTPPATETQTAGTDTSRGALETLIQTLLQQIKDLQDQMAKLKGEQTTTPPPTTPPLAASCTWNGQTIASGSSITAYQSSMVDFGMQCVSQTRTCTNGTLSGSYAYSSCTASGNTVQSCALDGVTIANGAIRKFYSQRTAESASACATAAIDRTCQNGTLSGSTMYQYASCSVQDNSICTPNAPQTQTLNCPTGQTGSIVQTRTSSCPGPTWSGWTTTSNTCTTPPTQPASCTFNGSTVAHGQSVTAYQASTATQCVSEQRTCNNGSLSGSYTNASCTVSGGGGGTTSAVTCVSAADLPPGFLQGTSNPMLVPSGGSAPLTVRFWMASAPFGYYDSFSFEDGSPSLKLSAFPPATQCPIIVLDSGNVHSTFPVFTWTHTYASPGVYLFYRAIGGSPVLTPLSTVTVTGNTSDAQRNSNLASALTALESALQAIQKFLGL